MYKHADMYILIEVYIFRLRIDVLRHVYYISIKFERS